MEQICYGGREWNEDYAYSCEKYCFVLDGATSLIPEKYSKEESDAKWYSHSFGKFLETALSDFSKSISEIIKEGIDIIINEYKALAGDKKIVDFPSSCVAVIRRNKNKIEYFVLGDCGILFKRKNDIKDFTDTILPVLDKKNIDDMVKIAKQKHIDAIEARKFVDADILKKRLSKNTDGGYWILCDDKTACDHAIQGELKIKKGDEFLLYSDGFSQIWDTVKIKSKSEVFEFLGQGGTLVDLYKMLYAEQESDFACNKYPRTKVRDDATAIYLKM